RHLYRRRPLRLRRDCGDRERPGGANHRLPRRSVRTERMDFGQQYLGVAVVLGLLGAALWWLRRRGMASFPAMRRAGRRMEAVERLTLGPQHSLHLVRVGDETLLIACSAESCSLLQTTPVLPVEAGMRGSK